jgi:type IV secretory pathway VirD2 relaxase
MRQMEQDLDPQLEWVAVDHHNTGHPHTHVIVWGITDDGKILEIEVARKLAREVDAERLGPTHSANATNNTQATVGAITIQSTLRIGAQSL